MAAGEEASTSRSLQETPTWAVATVCFVFISLSIIIEYLIHRISNWLKRRRKIALFDAVEKLKSVLMVLGFMSLILTVSRSFISKICIPNEVANSMLPCRKTLDSIRTTQDLGYDQIWSVHGLHERILDDENVSPEYCDSKGKTSLISEEGANQLSIFIFVLAAMQIVYTVLTMALGRAKMRRWKTWEKETLTVEYQAANGKLLPTFIPPFMWFLVVIFLLVDVHVMCCFKRCLDLNRLECVSMGFIYAIDNSADYGSQTASNIGKNGTQSGRSEQCNPRSPFGATQRQLLLNAFEVAFFVWVTTQYGIKSCYHENREIIATRVVLAVTVQVICSYVTLPLYALVTQMGSNFKRAVLEEQTTNAIKQWHAGVKLKRKKQRLPSQAAADDFPENSTTISTVDSSSHQPPTLASFEIGSSPEIQEAGPAMPTSVAVEIQMASVEKKLERDYRVI
ncbi:MLO-like protein 3 [Gossypium australe]|uniref:MLO-like protein n=1 Tax=Gossypium australe TaxID=47621 RepID=A0A5B6X8X7_9ROSI|nr:MLO-like protein 3 [Gossypium australe]